MKLFYTCLSKALRFGLYKINFVWLQQYIWYTTFSEIIFIYLIILLDGFCKHMAISGQEHEDNLEYYHESVIFELAISLVPFIANFMSYARISPWKVLETLLAFLCQSHYTVKYITTQNSFCELTTQILINSLS